MLLVGRAGHRRVGIAPRRRRPRRDERAHRPGVRRSRHRHRQRDHPGRARRRGSGAGRVGAELRRPGQVGAGGWGREGWREGGGGLHGLVPDLGVGDPLRDVGAAAGWEGGGGVEGAVDDGLVADFGVTHALTAGRALGRGRRPGSLSAGEGRFYLLELHEGSCGGCFGRHDAGGIGIDSLVEGRDVAANGNAAAGEALVEFVGVHESRVPKAIDGFDLGLNAMPHDSRVWEFG